MGQEVNSTYRLINAHLHHNFNFKAEKIEGDQIQVSVEAEGISGAKGVAKLTKGNEGEISFDVSNPGTTTYYAKGRFRWDEACRVIRFEGTLRLVLVAEVYFADCPVLEIPN